MSFMSLAISLADEYSRKCRRFFNKDPPVLFSSPETSQGKLQSYAMLAMYFRKEGNVTSSDQFLL